jgi:ABC-2 type transport system permease protein
MSLFLVQLWNELLKMFARKRTYIGFGAFLTMEGLMLVLFNSPDSRRHMRRLIEQNGYVFDQYFTGLTIALHILMPTAVLFGSLYLALVAGDVVAKEVEEGTLRMMLCRPVTRIRVLILKYFACVIYTFVFVFFIGLSALGASLLYRGWGGFLAYNPFEKIFALYAPLPGLERYLRALPFLALSLTTVTSIGFMFSCFNMKPAAATITTLSIIIMDIVFRNVPYFEDYQAWFVTTHMSAWIRTFVTYTPWWDIIEDYTYLLALDATCLVVALAVFQRRDFKA